MGVFVRKVYPFINKARVDVKTTLILTQPYLQNIQSHDAYRPLTLGIGGS